MLLQPELLLLLLLLLLQLAKLLLEVVLLKLLASPSGRERCGGASRVRSSEEVGEVASSVLFKLDGDVTLHEAWVLAEDGGDARIFEDAG